MKKSAFATCLVLTLCALPALADEQREFSSTITVDPAKPVYVKFIAGDLDVQAWDRPEIRAELTVRCHKENVKKCQRRLDAFEIVSRESSDALRLEFVAPPKRKHNRMSINAVVMIPRAMAVGIEMYAGNLEIKGIEQDLTVAMRYGDIDVAMPRASVHSVALDADFGAASISGVSQHVQSRRPFLVGAEVVWRGGEGQALVDVELGFGDISVRLD